MLKLTQSLNLDNLSNHKSKQIITRSRNICIVLSSLAEKLAGPNSIALLTSEILNYIINNLNHTNDPIVILFTLIALEKFAQTSKLFFSSD
jgi:MGC86306 protein, putative